MSYASIRDLRPAVKKVLPEHAQEIYRRAFNSAYISGRYDEASCVRVAWKAVKNTGYTKRDSGMWSRH